MQYITKLKLATSHQWCDMEDKSTEFMIQFLQDSCNVDLDTVLSYMNLGQKEHNKLRNELNGFLEFFENNFNDI